MASGKFSSSVVTPASGYRRYIEVVWKSTNEVSSNKSTISWTAYSRSPDSSKTNWVDAKNVVVTINGTSKTVIGSTATKLYKDKVIGSGSVTVNHNTDGTKTVSVGITARIYNYGSDNSTYSGSITMTRNPVYTLTIDPAEGSTIVVDRTSCAGSGSTGTLTAGSGKLCKGDKIKVSTSPKQNYKITGLKINNTNFTSGNTYTVGGNVTVTSTAQVLSSSIGATNADIGSVSTITITKYNQSYYHSLHYSFGARRGYITAAGKHSDSEVKFQNTPVAFTIPESFYAQIPDAKTGTCTITCKTYINGSTGSAQMGTATTCTFTVTAKASVCSPTVSGTVIDTNDVTKHLTGDENVLIKNRSTALCTIVATPRQSASITTKQVNGTATTNNQLTINNVNVTNFAFKATDSRGYATTATVTPTVIDYVPVTFNPILYRPSPTSDKILLKIDKSKFWKGTFGNPRIPPESQNGRTNQLIIQYRYGKSKGAYGDWRWLRLRFDNKDDDGGYLVKYDTENYTYYTSSDSPIELRTIKSQNATTGETTGEEAFSYKEEYHFQFKAQDGDPVYPDPQTGDPGTYTLSSVTVDVVVPRGIPVFDWGKDDFNFNVPTFVDYERAYLTKCKDVTFSNVALTSGSGAHYRSSGYSLVTDCGFPADPEPLPVIIGITLLNCSGLNASIVPYFDTSNNTINFYSDTSQTVTTVKVRIIYSSQ